MAKKSNFGPDFSLFWPKSGHQNFFSRVYLHQMSNIVANCHCMQFQGKLKNQTLKNGKKPSFRSNFCPFDPNVGPQKFSLWILPKLDVRHYCKLLLYSISMKIIKSNLRKWPKAQFQAHFWPVLTQNWSIKTFLQVVVASYHCMHSCTFKGN